MRKLVIIEILNNEIYSHLSFTQKENMKTLENIVLVWSPYDNILNPPESGKFSFYDEEYNIIPIEQTALYKEDVLGLKFLTSLIPDSKYLIICSL